MLAYIYNKDNKLELVEKDIPKAKDNTAILKMKACSICGTDFRTYMFGSKRIQHGTTVGHETCGEVVEIGKDVKGLSIGELVTVTPALGCGECYMCKKGHTNMCDNLLTIGFDFDGGFAEYMEIPAPYIERGYVNPVPAGVEPIDAALAEAVACTINAQSFLNISDGDTVAVFGSGLIGCMHAELAYLSGAKKVIMIELNEQRRKQALEIHPDLTMMEPGDDLVDSILKETDGIGVDVAIIACSAGVAQVQAQQIIAKRGRISLFGGLPGESCGFIDSNIIHYKELGVFGVHASTREQNRQALAWIGEGRINVRKYITTTKPIAEIESAFLSIKNEGIMKAVITF